MRVELSIGAGDARFGGHYAAASMHDGCLAGEHAGVVKDCAREIGLGFNRSVSSTCGEQRLHRAASCRVNQGHREAPVDHPQRVVNTFGRFTFKDCAAFADFGESETERDGHRRRRQFAACDSSEKVEARHFTSANEHLFAWPLEFELYFTF